MLDWTICHGRSVTLSYALYDAPSQLFDTVDEDDIVEAAVKYSNYDRVYHCIISKQVFDCHILFSKCKTEVLISVFLLLSHLLLGEIIQCCFRFL